MLWSGAKSSAKQSDCEYILRLRRRKDLRFPGPLEFPNHKLNLAALLDCQAD